MHVLYTGASKKEGSLILAAFFYVDESAG